MIEILVTITIVAILFVTSIRVQNSLLEERKLTAETQRLLSVLELTQKKAETSDLSTPCVGEFLGYRVIPNSTTYRIQSHCQTSDAVVQSYSFSTGIQLDSSTPIDFARLTGKPTESCIRIRNTNINQCRCIQVQASGVITQDKCTSCSSCP